MIYYSPANKGFYRSEINQVIPDDKIEVSDDYYKELFDGQAQGKTIEPNDVGYPVLVDPPEITLEQRQAAAVAQRQAAYQKRSDPLYFRLQRGDPDVTREMWLAEIELIKTEIPYPVE
jgi:hypothetical protein